MFADFKALALPVALVLACTAGASATTITYQTFDATQYAAIVGTAPVEDFENINAVRTDFEAGTRTLTSTETTPQLYGEINGSLSTSVGTFTTAGGTGGGSTCRSLSLNGNSCDNIALQFRPDRNGQGNIWPTNGAWSLNSNDTLGMVWQAGLAGGALFNTLVFALQDAADVGATMTVNAPGATPLALRGLSNNNRQLFVVRFSQAVRSAEIRLTNTRTNDAFTLDGASLFMSGGGGGGVPSPVPLPAGAWLMLTGLGGLALMRRRNRQA